MSRPMSPLRRTGRRKTTVRPRTGLAVTGRRAGIQRSRAQPVPRIPESFSRGDEFPGWGLLRAALFKLTVPFMLPGRLFFIFFIFALLLQRTCLHWLRGRVMRALP